MKLFLDYFLLLLIELRLDLNIVELALSKIVKSLVQLIELR